MILEEQRFLHEDLERLEQGISDRVADEPKQIRERLTRDHQVSGFLTRIQDQSQRLLDIYRDADGARQREIQVISTGDPFEEFYKQLNEIRDFHRRYPNEPVENLERAYKKRVPGEGDPITSEVDAMFTGEEAYGRFLDLTMLHEDYLNLKGVKRLSYLQYLDSFDVFTPPQCPITKAQKATDQYFTYVRQLVSYLEGVLKRTRPLEDLDKLFHAIDEEFEKAWDAGEVPGWGAQLKAAGPTIPATPEGSGRDMWCADCEKEFKNENVYKNHLTGKKHIRAAEARKARGVEDGMDQEADGQAQTQETSLRRLKDRVIADREFRIRKLAEVLQQVRVDTRVNIERRQGMTERERQMELDALFAESAEQITAGGDDDSESDSDEKIYNPLKLPLAWDGKPIPYWLYKLHGLGVEFPCEICGNFVYMGRRAFDKHFNEARHIYGLKCLGITNTTLFREITGIEDALKLWDKIQRDKKKEKTSTENVVQMEDAEGNVMPEKVYYEYVITNPPLYPLLALASRELVRAAKSMVLTLSLSLSP
ncbi:hypothetical protein GP486_007080 [Trichoglossum hirsutum]|uniref:Matrin-type domain-containing protein n=1 Tax=Trichoglossum hirsutum TaxID=265104 RepID=A0A9P8IGB7_9PEZI|nr:hypothetical protein GP486_007080 [Trichoglossum hirsutum]